MNRGRLALSVTLVFTGLILPVSVAHMQTEKRNADQQLARDLYQQLVEINTTDSVGNCTQAAEANVI